MGWLKFIASSLGTVSFLSIYVLLLKIWPAAGLQTFGTSALPQHLQGVLNHGRNFTIYRTFHNIINDSNLQIHCFLLSLESTLRAEHKLPDTVYYQVDGGSENIAKVVHLICELIIARRLTKKIVLSRLMVGHTHEDIDARFGVIWSSIRQEHVLSPQMYASMIRRSFDRSFPVEVEDIWIVPNYTKLLSPCMDKKFGRYAKGEWTQLQFIFQSVPVETDFPLVVKTTYQRYCADQVMEVERKEISRRSNAKPSLTLLLKWRMKTVERNQKECISFKNSPFLIKSNLALSKEVGEQNLTRRCERFGKCYRLQ